MLAIVYPEIHCDGVTTISFSKTNEIERKDEL
jgi:hypothetical protein